MRLLADTNIVAIAVRTLRADGHDVAYVAERPADPGDPLILAEAKGANRVFITKDHDTGELVFRDDAPHAGVLLIDDLGDPAAETALIRTTLAAFADELARGAFVRAGRSGTRVASL